MSPYAAFENSPLLISDVSGACPDGNCGEKEVVAAYDIVKKNFDPKHNLYDISTKLKEAVSDYWYNEVYLKPDAKKGNKIFDYVKFQALVFDMWENAIASAALSNTAKNYDHYLANDKIIQGMSSDGGKAVAILKLSSEDRQKVDFFMKVLVPNIIEYFKTAAFATDPNMTTPSRSISRAGSFTLNSSANLFGGIAKGAGKVLGQRGEELTELMLRRAYPNATIAKQVLFKMGRYTKTYCDFVVVQDGEIIALWESKVNSAEMSVGQEALYIEGKAGTFTGKAAKQYGLSGESIPANAVKNEIRYNSTTGSSTIYKY